MRLRRTLHRTRTVLLAGILILSGPAVLLAQSDKNADKKNEKKAANPSPPPKGSQPGQAPHQQPREQPPSRQDPSTRGATKTTSGTPGAPNAPATGAQGVTSGTPGQRGANSSAPGSAAANSSARGSAGGNRDNGRPGTSSGNTIGAAASTNRPPGGRANGSGTRSNVPPTTPMVVKTIRTPTGHSLGYDNAGTLRSVTTNRGTVANLGAQGRVRSIQTTSGTLIRYQSGGKRVESERVSPNGARYRVVSTTPRRGYVERDFSRNGATYVRRTYVYESRTYVSVYRTYYYGGSPYRYYVPAYYYAPTYYRWVYDPWPAPVYYAWGWNTAPWYAPYGYYFAPYPVYPSAAFWLTDYLIAENLRAAYEARAAADASAVAAAQPAQGASAALSPEVKQLIAEEVKVQLAAEEAAAQSKTTAGAPAMVAPQSDSAEQAPPALDPRLRVFVVSTSLDVVNAGEPCSLNPGDVLMRVENTPDNDGTVAVNVVSSQNASCSPGASPRVQIADLQEMHNHFREQIDNGLKALAENRGQGGLPIGPAASARSNPEGTAGPDLSAVADVQKQQNEAGDAEQDVQKASPGTGAKQ